MSDFELWIMPFVIAALYSLVLPVARFLTEAFANGRLS